MGGGNYILTSDGELYHYGVPGMKWGQRKARTDTYAKRYYRDHAGPGKYATRKRQLAGDKRDLEGLKNGQHLRYGVGKKRQAAFDARDKRLLEKRIAENEAKLTKKQTKRAARPEKVKAIIGVGAGAATGILASHIAGKAVDNVGGSLIASLGARFATSALVSSAVSNAIVNSGTKNEAKKQRKQLQKEYGRLEDQMTYGKNADAKKNASISKRMNDIEKQLNRMG